MLVKIGLSSWEILVNISMGQHTSTLTVVYRGYNVLEGEDASVIRLGGIWDSHITGIAIK